MTLKINTNFKFLKSKIQQIFKKKKERNKQTFTNIHTQTHTHINIYAPSCCDKRVSTRGTSHRKRVSP